MTILKSACLLILPACAAICADPGSIGGKILTAAGPGAAVPKAPVQAKNLDTNETYKATSASDGSYNLSGLVPGAYEISVENFTFFLPFHQSLVENDHVIEALAANRPDDAFHVSALPWRSRRAEHLLRFQIGHLLAELDSKDPISATEQILRRLVGGKCLPQLLPVYSAIGWKVTLKWTIRLRS